MAARGSQIKAEITQKILDTFEGSFINDKEIRIPGMEDGSEIQIKVTLTAAKTNVENAGSGSMTPTATASQTPDSQPSRAVPREPTNEEKARVSELLEKLGLS